MRRGRQARAQRGRERVVIVGVACFVGEGRVWISETVEDTWLRGFRRVPTVSAKRLHEMQRSLLFLRVRRRALDVIGVLGQAGKTGVGSLEANAASNSNNVLVGSDLIESSRTAD